MNKVKRRAMSALLVAVLVLGGIGHISLPGTVLDSVLRLLSPLM